MKQQVLPIDPHVPESDKPRLTGQNSWVLERLRQGPLTPLQAMQEKNIMRLAARVHDLKAAGYDVRCERLADGVACYSLSEA